MPSDPLCWRLRVLSWKKFLQRKTTWLFQGKQHFWSNRQLIFSDIEYARTKFWGSRWTRHNMWTCFFLKKKYIDLCAHYYIFQSVRFYFDTFNQFKPRKKVFHNWCFEMFWKAVYLYVYLCVFEVCTEDGGSPAARLRFCTFNVSASWVKQWSKAMGFLQTLLQNKWFLRYILENYIIKG